MIPLDRLEDHGRVLRYRVVSATQTYALFASPEAARRFARALSKPSGKKGTAAVPGIRVIDDILRTVLEL